MKGSAAGDHPCWTTLRFCSSHVLTGLQIYAACKGIDTVSLQGMDAQAEVLLICQLHVSTSQL